MGPLCRGRLAAGPVRVPRAPAPPSLPQARCPERCWGCVAPARGTVLLRQVPRGHPADPQRALLRQRAEGLRERRVRRPESVLRLGGASQKSEGAGGRGSGASGAEPNAVHPQGFPIIFHGVRGEDRREAKSPSFFNTAEIEVLLHYLRQLLQSRGRGGCPSVSPKEVGIISPYRKQVRGTALRAGDGQRPPGALGRMGRDLLGHWDGRAALRPARKDARGWLDRAASIPQVEKIQKAVTSLDPVLRTLPDISLLKVQSWVQGERSPPLRGQRDPPSPSLLPPPRWARWRSSRARSGASSSSPPCAAAASTSSSTRSSSWASSRTPRYRAAPSRPVSLGSPAPLRRPQAGRAAPRPGGAGEGAKAFALVLFAEAQRGHHQGQGAADRGG